MLTAQEFIDRIHNAGVIGKPRVAAYGEAISKHLTVGIDMLWSPDTREIVILKPMIDLFEKAREIVGHPIPVSAGYRTLNHEHELQKRGLKTVKFVSPHCFGAMDLDARPVNGHNERTENFQIQAALVAAAKVLGLPRPRLGHKSYGEHFTHVDLVFMLFKPYTALDHPADWDWGLDAGNRAAFNSAWREGVEW